MYFYPIIILRAKSGYTIINNISENIYFSIIDRGVVMKNKYRNLRIIFFVISTIIYYLLGVFLKIDSLKWLINISLIASIILGFCLLIFDIRRLKTNKKRVFSFLLLFIIALSLEYLLETYFYNVSVSLKIIMVLAFIIFYSLYMNFEVFKIEYK